MARDIKKYSACKHEHLRVTEVPCVECWHNSGKPSWEGRASDMNFNNNDNDDDNDTVTISVPQIAVNYDTGLRDIPQELLDGSTVAIIKEDLRLLLSRSFNLNTDDKNRLFKIQTAIEFLNEHHIIMRKGLGFEMIRTRELKSIENKVNHLETMTNHLKQLLDFKDSDTVNSGQYLEQISALEMKYDRLDSDRKNDSMIFNKEMERLRSVVRDSKSSVIKMYNKLAKQTSEHDRFVRDIEWELSNQTEELIKGQTLLEKENQRLESLIDELNKRLKDVGESSVEMLWED